MPQYPRKLKRGIRWWYKFDFKRKKFRSNCIYLSQNDALHAEAQAKEKAEKDYLEEQKKLSEDGLLPRPLQIIKTKRIFTKMSIVFRNTKKGCEITIQYS